MTGGAETAQGAGFRPFVYLALTGAPSRLQDCGHLGHIKGSRGKNHGVGCPREGHDRVRSRARRRRARARRAVHGQGQAGGAGPARIEGRRLSCGATATLLRDFEGFAVSSTVIMLNMQALKELPRPVQWLIYYHECGHILYRAERSRRRLLRHQARAARRLAQRPGPRGHLRRVQYRRPRPDAPRSRGPLRPAKAMLRQEKRRHRPRRNRRGETLRPIARSFREALKLVIMRDGRAVGGLALARRVAGRACACARPASAQEWSFLEGSTTRARPSTNI